MEATEAKEKETKEEGGRRNGRRRLLLVLVSSSTPDRTQESDRRRLLSLLEAAGIGHEVVDGSDPNMKGRRDELFRISGLRARYPQVFLLPRHREGEGEAEANASTDADASDAATYLGGYREIEEINDASSSSSSILSHPASTAELRSKMTMIATWDGLLG